MKSFFVLACVGALVGTSARAVADVTVSTETYRGWKDAVRVSNGTVEFVVVPQIGRVMSYGFTGKANVLWENPALDGGNASGPGYQNYGGDKLWFAPQTAWGWPPEPAVDGQPHKVTMIKNGVRLESPTGTKFKVRTIRDVTLSSFGTEVRFTNRVINGGATPMEIANWQVTQVNDPSRIELPIERTARQSFGYAVLVGGRLDPKYQALQGDKLVIARSPEKGYKFGAKPSKGSLSAKVGGDTIVMSQRVLPRRKYADQDSAFTVYTSPNPTKYAELEAMGPLEALQPRGVQEHVVTWSLR